MRELEEKRINKEMAHIRQKFKGAFTRGLSLALGGGDKWEGANAFAWCSQRGTWMDGRRRSELAFGSGK